MWLNYVVVFFDRLTFLIDSGNAVDVIYLVFSNVCVCVGGEGGWRILGVKSPQLLKLPTLDTPAIVFAAPSEGTEHPLLAPKWGEDRRQGPLHMLCGLQGFSRECQLCKQNGPRHGRQPEGSCLAGEDDVFVNPVGLTEFLRRTPNVSHFIHGHIHYHPAVKRIGRDAIPLPLFPLGHYPHFALEKGFLVPGAALPALYQASLRLPTFPLSGAYWGFLALAVQLPHKHSGDFRASEEEDHLTFYQKSLMVHGVSMERMESVWQEFSSSTPGWPK